MNEWRYCLKCNKNISILTHFQQYLHSFIQSAMLTGRGARQTHRLYVLRMIVKLAYSMCEGCNLFQPKSYATDLHRGGRKEI